ncbi:hypothetical protein [Petrocella sp. FN5]|uniref:hypothetical protein n=1 Tax=Petrocella sp. FN5 TaxID=3032002 RepID=UPI0023DCD199|nr:hypothetical protein [Petrocella sp. FN5]MDF1618764.1 hypothetical protein [Petrocella sp. FN5]
MEQSLIDTLNAYIEKQLDTQLDTSKEDHNPLSSLEDYIYLNHMPSFRELLFNLIDESNALDSDIFERAGIDMDHFIDMRLHPNIDVDINTVIRLCLALELTLDETESLLYTAGFSLDTTKIFDLIVQFCIEHKIYEIADVNEALAIYHIDPLIVVST